MRIQLLAQLHQILRWLSNQTVGQTQNNRSIWNKFLKFPNIIFNAIIRDSKIKSPEKEDIIDSFIVAFHALIKALRVPQKDVNVELFEHYLLINSHTEKIKSVFEPLNAFLPLFWQDLESYQNSKTKQSIIGFNGLYGSNKIYSKIIDGYEIFSKELPEENRKEFYELVKKVKPKKKEIINLISQ